MKVLAFLRDVRGYPPLTLGPEGQQVTFTPLAVDARPDGPRVVTRATVAGRQDRHLQFRHPAGGRWEVRPVDEGKLPTSRIPPPLAQWLEDLVKACTTSR